MFNRKGFAAVAACAALACAGVARASDRAFADCCASDSFTLSTPVMADANAPAARKPLMALLDKAGAASTLDQWGLNIYGFIEGSWTYNFQDPGNHLNGGRTFDVEDQDPTLNQLDLTIERAIAASGDKFDIGGKMEWIWGGDARFIHANGLFDHYGFSDGPDNQFDPVQAYLTLNIPVGEGVLVTAGKFVTLLGYETINPTNNPLFSHSYIFNFAIPFTHTGLMAKYQLTKDWSVTGAVVRGWDQALEDNNGDWMSYMGQLAYSKDKLDFYFNAITGPEQTDNHSDYRTVLNAVVVYRWSDEMTFAVDSVFGWEPDSGPPTPGGTHTRDSIWWGAAAYMTYKFDNHFSFQGRAEYFNDESTGARGINAAVTELTAGLNVHPCPDNQWLSGLVIRPEVRYDWGTESLFAFDPKDGSSSDNQITFGIDAIYSF